MYLQIAILSTLLVELLDVYLTRRQIKHNRYPLPDNLKGIVKPEDHLKSQKYQNDCLRYTVVYKILSLAFSLYVLSKKFYPALWAAIENRTNFSEIPLSLAFLGINTLIDEIIFLPFDLYSDFVIEKTHGFNKKTLSLFFMDKLKWLLITAVIGAPVVSAVIFLVHWGGTSFYIYVWLFSILFTGIMTFIIPTVIMPMFYKFEAVQDTELVRKIEQLVK